MPPTLISGTVGLAPIYKNRPATSRSSVDRMWSRISSRIGSNSSFYNSLCRKVSSIHVRSATHRVVFNKIVECRMHKIVGSKQTISCGASNNKEMFKLRRRRIALIRTAIRDHVAPDLITQSYEEWAVPFAAQLVLRLTATNYTCQWYTINDYTGEWKIFFSSSTDISMTTVEFPLKQF